MTTGDTTSDRSERLQALFGHALELEPATRDEFLAHETRGDDDLHGEVLALIAAYDRKPSPSGRRPGSPTPDRPAADDVRWIGQQVGPWRVTRCIGRGGMGTVCEANRADAQFEKRVAIKFLRRQAREPGAIQRFRAERQMLANLEHPNIATLLDGGVTADGRPYLVMEYVDGDPITVWAQARGLGRRRRVELFLQVCAAVEAAHRQLIVHRDLKPGNVLVTRDGRVKLLDFGIARLLDEGVTEAASAVGSGPRSFTPAYAAPEQVRAAPVSTSTDVFALGVVLYQLLTGRLPPERGADPEAPATPAGLDADLDAVLARALEFEPVRRYATVQALREDLERWLERKPVAAHPDSRGYRLRKFLGRHRARSTLATLALAAILAAGGLAAWQARVARQAAADMRQWNEFLLDVLRMSNPFDAGDELTLSAALDRAALEIDTRFASRPDLSAEIRFGIGASMADRNRLEQADAQLSRALQESVAVFGDADIRTLRVLEAVAGLRVEQSRFPEAERGYRAVIAALVHGGLEADPLHAMACGNLGNLYLMQERYREADRMLQQARALDDPHRSLDPVDRAALLNNQAHAAHGLEEHARADALYTEAASAYRALFPQGSPDLAVLYNNHALLHQDRGDRVRALALHRESLAMRRKVFHDAHPMVVTALSNVARLLLETGSAPEALTLAREGAATADRVYTEPNRFHPAIFATLAAAELDNGDAAAARDAWLRARTLLDALPEPPPSTVRWVEQTRIKLCGATGPGVIPCQAGDTPAIPAG